MNDEPKITGRSLGGVPDNIVELMRHMDDTNARQVRKFWRVSFLAFALVCMALAGLAIQFLGNRVVGQRFTWAAIVLSGLFCIYTTYDYMRTRSRLKREGKWII